MSVTFFDSREVDDDDLVTSVVGHDRWITWLILAICLVTLALAGLLVLG